ncbi:MAG TPA: fasciclin domain-containing protein [Fodinibius sp.]|nr:fasciclin domain-containing protein [Fodinibius sp.]
MKRLYAILLEAALFFLVAGSFMMADAQTVLEALKNNGRTTEFAAAIERAGLENRFDTRSGSYTVFAPSNTAFNKMNSNEKNNSRLLLNHIITGTATKRSLQYMSKMTCLSGLTVEVSQDDNTLSVQDYPLLESNIQADNGVIHVIDGVIQ